VDRSGDVTKEEMKDLLDQMHLSNSINFDEIWDALDKDKSGEVTRKEWDECFSAVAVAPSSDSTSNTIVSWRIKPGSFAIALTTIRNLLLYYTIKRVEDGRERPTFHCIFSFDLKIRARTERKFLNLNIV
jgi:hypothetical protein